jgi:hypothetical protein
VGVSQRNNGAVKLIGASIRPKTAIPMSAGPWSNANAFTYASVKKADTIWPFIRNREVNFLNLPGCLEY